MKFLQLLPILEDKGSPAGAASLQVKKQCSFSLDNW